MVDVADDGKVSDAVDGKHGVVSVPLAAGMALTGGRLLVLSVSPGRPSGAREPIFNRLAAHVGVAGPILRGR